MLVDLQGPFDFPILMFITSVRVASPWGHVPQDHIVILDGGIVALETAYKMLLIVPHRQLLFILAKMYASREIISEILLLHSDLTHFCHCRVYITQFVTSPSHSSATVSDITEVNRHLRRTLPKYQFWCHRRTFTAGVKSSVMYNRDRAHLNHTGMSQYYSSIRALVARAVRHIC